jgi:peptide/nickel transport system substrate-binding protein
VGSTTRKAMLGWLLFLPAVHGCGPADRDCARCGTVVIAATGEPESLVPPLVYETVGRDISDLVYERLADLAPGAPPIDTASYRPGLAARWERVDSLTWQFHLRRGARWHDGKPVTAGDVVFSFAAFTDSTLDSPARSYLMGRVTATATDSSTVLIRFTEPSTEQLYDATYHVRVLPRHIWETIPRERWQGDTVLSHLAGSGPYRVRAWKRGQYLALERDTVATAGRGIARVMWRFAPDADAALNLVLSHEADLLESVGSPDRVRRVAADSNFELISYPAAMYGFLAFRLAEGPGRGSALTATREARRALTAAIDRRTLARAVFGAGARVPPGPMSQLLWIWDDSIHTVPFDSAGAAGFLQGVRTTRAAPRLDILVPATSPSRRQIALVIQEAWRRIGVEASVTVVDFPVFQERLAKGRFDAYIGSYLDEPSPRGLADQWSRSGWSALNYGRYSNASFDSLLTAASRQPDVRGARRLWRQAMDTLNADAPAIFLYAPANMAAVHRRLGKVTLDPYSWLRGLPEWRIDAGRALGRDSVR